MPRIAAALLGLCLIVGLTACNRVVTPTPLFTAQDATGAPRLREGLWVVEGETFAQTRGGSGDEAVCVFDTRRPVRLWPDCAQWVVVRGNEMLRRDKGAKGKASWQSNPIALVAGEPLVLQAGLVDEEDPTETEYGYFGISATRTDEQGRITAFDHWMTLCGAPPPQGDGQPTRYLTWELLPGLTGEGDNCTTSSRDAVRSATAASRAWSSGQSSMRWVRDGDR